jgi:tetraacyldisaccharide 4'-kinase
VTPIPNIPLAISYPLSWAYDRVTTFRNKLYDRRILPSYRSRLPVVCIGNCTVGGTGKTPLVIWTARYLTTLGLRPVVLSRGYGGATRGPHRVSENDSYTVVGDEPSMLKTLYNLSVVISSSRVNGARFIEEHDLGNVIVLDDGFQHRALERDLNVLCFNVSHERAVADLNRGALLPRGIFRERLEQALVRADVIVLSSRSAESYRGNTAWLDSVCSEVPVVVSSVIPRLVPPVSTPAHSLKRVRLVSSIADPHPFLSTVQSMGVSVLEHVVLPDHSSQLGAVVERMLNESDEVVVVTEKDLVKIASHLRDQVAVCSIQIRTEGLDSLQRSLEALVKKSS